MAIESAALEGKARVVGFVRDAHGVGIGQTTVSVEVGGELKNIVVSDDRGYFEFNDLPNGRYFVGVQYYAGNQDQIIWASADTREFELRSDQCARVAFVLHPAPLTGLLIHPPWNESTTSTGDEITHNLIDNVPVR